VAAAGTGRRLLRLAAGTITAAGTAGTGGGWWLLELDTGTGWLQLLLVELDAVGGWNWWKLVGVG